MEGDVLLTAEHLCPKLFLHQGLQMFVSGKLLLPPSSLFVQRASQEWQTDPFCLGFVNFGIAHGWLHGWLGDILSRSLPLTVHGAVWKKPLGPLGINRSAKVCFGLWLVLKREIENWAQSGNVMVVHNNTICPICSPTLIPLYTEIPKSFPSCSRISLLTPQSCSPTERKTSDNSRTKIYW